MFLEIDELKTVRTAPVVELITNSDDDTVNQIINESIDIMKSYLFKYYDTDKIFNATGDNRSKMILKYLKDIVIYEIHKIRATRFDEVLKLDYDEAIGWLDKVSSGKIDADLPPKVEEGTEEQKPFMRIGSRKSYRNHF